jgi:hypothetical protein
VRQPGLSFSMQTRSEVQATQQLQPATKQVELVYKLRKGS